MNFLVDQRGFLVLKLNIRGTLLGAWRQGGGTARLLLLPGDSVGKYSCLLQQYAF